MIFSEESMDWLKASGVRVGRPLKLGQMCLLKIMGPDSNVQIYISEFVYNLT